LAVLPILVIFCLLGATNFKKSELANLNNVIGIHVNYYKHNFVSQVSKFDKPCTKKCADLDNNICQLVLVSAEKYVGQITSVGHLVRI
jgi:hypothetical protein